MIEVVPQIQTNEGGERFHQANVSSYIAILSIACMCGRCAPEKKHEKAKKDHQPHKPILSQLTAIRYVRKISPYRCDEAREFRAISRMCSFNETGNLVEHEGGLC